MKNIKAADSNRLRAAHDNPTTRTRLRRGVSQTLACLALVLALASQALASTFVCGNISGTWTKTGSPYIATCNCTVPAGQSLTIQPGVTFIIGQGLRVDVLGSISAVGTAAERITIRGANSSLYWDEMLIDYTGGEQSRFSNCTFSDATNLIHLNILNLTATLAPQISNCTFSNCTGTCIYASSSGTPYSGAGGAPPNLHDPDLNALVTNCRFTGSSNGIHFYIGSETRYGYWPGRGAINSTLANNFGQALSGTALRVENVEIGPVGNDRPSNLGVANSLLMQCRTGIEKTGSSAFFNDEIGYNCFYNNQTNFIGYPPGVYGTICCANDNGTPCDLAYNIFTNPLFAETNTYTLANNSPCIDAGNPAGAYLDSCFPPSKGTTINDIGIYGGPSACGWLTNQVTSFSLTAQKFVGVTINPSAAGRYRLEYVDSLVTPPATNGPWTQATNLLLLSTPYTYIDFTSPTTGKRFYRAVLLP